MVALLSSKAAVGLNRPSICTRRAVAVTMTRPKVAVAPMSTSKRSSTMARAAAEAEPNASNDNEGFYEAVSVGMDDSMSLPDLKAALLDSLYGTERGLSARSEVRAEINELISQMESMSPVPNPTEALDKLSGNWKLVYTSNSELMAVLALSKLPLVDIGDITQKIDAEDAKVENKVRLSVPFTRTSLSTTASFEVAAPKRLQLRLTKGGIQTPELISDLNLPPYVTVMGTTVDLGPLKSAIGPMQSAASGVLSQVNNLLSQLPPPQVDISNDSAQTWQLNTYVDDDTRISRGDGGSVFIYVREAELDDWPPAEPVIAAVEPEAEEDVV